MRGPSTAEERAQFVVLVRSLETDPLAESASATRQRLQEWAYAIPDLSFRVCPELLGHALRDDYPYSRALEYQVMLSGAVLTIERPGEARDDAAVYTAGVEGALRAYEVLVKSRPDARLAALDDLLDIQRRDGLADHVATLAKKKCKRTNLRLIAAPSGAAVGLLLALGVARWFGRGGARQQSRGGTAGTVRGIVLACAAYYLIVGIALHFLEPEYDPRFYPMSHYAWGTYGWLMRTTFFVLGLAAFTLARRLRSAMPPSRGARIGLGLLVVAAPFVCLAGVFRGFPLHDVASAIALPSFSLAVLFLSWSFRDSAGWQAISPVTILIAVVMVVALLSIIVDVGMPGLQQRAFLFLLLVWLSIVVHHLVRVKAVPEPGR